MGMVQSPRCRALLPRALATELALVLVAAVSVSGAAAHASEDDKTLPAKPDATTLNVWVDKAPLNLVVDQLARISGREAEISGELEGEVSGRFNGTVSDALTRLSEDHEAVFDLQEDTLAAVPAGSASHVSIALDGMSVSEAMRTSLEAQAVQGNRVEFREDSVRLSGHPEFVKRLAIDITNLSSKSEQEEQRRQERLEQARAEPAQQADDAVSEVPEAELAIEEVATQLTTRDAGAQAMLEDIQDEQKPESDRAALAKPIRWVTDIPGFNTF